MSCLVYVRKKKHHVQSPSSFLEDTAVLRHNDKTTYPDFTKDMLARLQSSRRYPNLQKPTQVAFQANSPLRIYARARQKTGCKWPSVLGKSPSQSSIRGRIFVRSPVILDAENHKICAIN